MKTQVTKIPSIFDKSFATLLPCIIIGLYPIIFFLSSFIKINTHVVWCLYLFLFLSVFYFSWTYIYKIIHQNTLTFENVKNNFNIKNFLLNHLEILFFVCFLLWACLSTFLSKDIPRTLFGIHSRYQLEGYILFLFYAFCFFLGFKLNGKNNRMIFISTFLFSSVFIGIATFFDTDNNIIPAFVNSTSNWASIFVNSNHYGYYLVLVIMLSGGLFLTQSKPLIKYISLFIYIFNSIILSLNDTLGSSLAVIVSLIIIFIIMSIKYKKLSYKALLLLVIFSLVIVIFKRTIIQQIISLFSDDVLAILSEPSSTAAKSAGTGRWKLWMEALESIKTNPLFGNGNVNQRPHNEFLQYAQVWGLPALLFYLLALFTIFIKAFKYLGKLQPLTLVLSFIVGGYLISSFFGNTMPHVMPYFCIFLGMLSFEVNKSKLKLSSN